MTRLWFLLIAAIATGCIEDDDDDTPADDDFGADDGDTGDDTTPPENTDVWRATLTSIDPSVWSLSGSSVVRQRQGEQAFTAQIDIRNDFPGVTRPWHVHFGTCGSTGGPIVGTDAIYLPLSTGLDGIGMLALMIRVGLDLGLPYYVDVHESEDQFTTRIACGDLVLQ